MPISKSQEKSLRRKAQRFRLFHRQGGLCYYCNQPMEIFTEPNLKPFPPHGATFEHLDDRWSPERGKHPNEFRVVLACFRCNNGRNTQREAEQPIEELHRRSRSFPMLNHNQED